MAVDSDRKPILLTVDDDPGVSRAVARDLRRNYGDAYRVVRTESGPQALETLRELKLRGDLVAVLLADHRMPEMSGLEFLEEAMDLPQLEAILRRMLAGELELVARDTTEPSPLASEIVNARVYQFLDDAPLEERRTQAVYTRRSTEPSSSTRT